MATSGAVLSPKVTLPPHRVTVRHPKPLTIIFAGILEKIWGTTHDSRNHDSRLGFWSWFFSNGRCGLLSTPGPTGSYVV